MKDIMKNIDKKTKIFAVLICLFIIVGIIITLTVGLNYELKYKDAKRIELYLQKDYEISDLKDITKEVLQNKEVLIQKIEVFEDSASIITKEMTDDQKNEIINKVNEKYGTDISAEDVKIEDVPHTRLMDIVKPYFSPFIIATLIILAYMGIRYRKLGVILSIIKTGIVLFITQAFLLSAMAIFRIPVGIVTIPLVLVAYIISLMSITTKFEKDLEEKVNKEDK